MANTCNSKVHFTGNEKDLKSIVDNIITLDKERKQLSYKLIEHLVPSDKDEFLYEKIGINYTDYLLHFSAEKKEDAREKMKKFLKENNYIGTNQEYINRRIWEFDYTLENNSLILEIESAWHCPVNFFIYIAQEFNVNFFIYEQVEGNQTTIYYKENNTIQEIELNIENLVYNKEFQSCLLQYGIYKAEHILLATYLAKDISLFSNLLKKNTTSAESFFTLIDNEISFLKDIDYNYSITPISILTSLDEDELQGISYLNKAKEDYVKSIQYLKLSENLSSNEKSATSLLKI